MYNDYMSGDLIGIGFVINNVVAWRVGGDKSLIELVFTDENHI